MSRTTPREVTLEEKAWLAGILDGEGSITLVAPKKVIRKNGEKQNKVFYGIYFVAAENGWIEKAHEIVNRMWSGEGSPIKLQDKKYQPGIFKTNKNMKQFCVRRQETIKTVLKSTLPYLTEKKSKANLLLSFLENRVPYSRVTDEEIEKYVTPVETKRTTP
jgi:hypothetical protein